MTPATFTPHEVPQTVSQKGSTQSRRYYLTVSIISGLLTILSIVSLIVIAGFRTQLVGEIGRYSQVIGASDLLGVNGAQVNLSTRPTIPQLTSELAALTTVIADLEGNGLLGGSKATFDTALVQVSSGVQALILDPVDLQARTDVQVGASIISAEALKLLNADIARSDLLATIALWAAVVGVAAIIGVAYLSVLINVSITGLLRWNSEIVTLPQTKTARKKLPIIRVPLVKLFPGAGRLAEQSAVISREFSRQVDAQQKLLRKNKKLSRALQVTIDDLNLTREEFKRNARLAAVGNIAGSVSHEINNPVTGILGYLAFVRKRNKNPELLVYIEKATHEVERIGRIAKSLLVFSRRTTKQILTPFDMGPSLDSVATLVGISMHEASVTLKISTPKSLPTVLGRVDEFQQSLLNLLLNSRDAVKHSKKKLVFVDVKKVKKTLEVSVTDTGTGVSPEGQKHLFETFYTTKPTGEGSGLGLAVARELMDRMGGSVVFDPTFSPGARFVLTLPIYDASTPVSSVADLASSQISAGVKLPSLTMETPAEVLEAATAAATAKMKAESAGPVTLQHAGDPVIAASSAEENAAATKPTAKQRVSTQAAMKKSVAKKPAVKKPNSKKS